MYLGQYIKLMCIIIIKVTIIRLRVNSNNNRKLIKSIYISIDIDILTFNNISLVFFWNFFIKNFKKKRRLVLKYHISKCSEKKAQ